MERKPELHVSALSDDEHRHYSRALAAVASVRDYESVHEVSAVKVRRYLAGHYVIEDDAVEKILRIFHPVPAWNDTLTPNQFYALLRLVSHTQRGRDVDRKLIFSQTPPPIAIDPPNAPPPATPKFEPPAQSSSAPPKHIFPKRVEAPTRSEAEASSSGTNRPAPPKPSSSLEPSPVIRPASPPKRAPVPPPKPEPLVSLTPERRSPSPPKHLPPPTRAKSISGRSVTSTPVSKPLPPDPPELPARRTPSPTRPAAPPRPPSNPFRRSSHSASSSSVSVSTEMQSNPFRTSSSAPVLPTPLPVSPPPPPLPRRPSTSIKPPLPPRLQSATSTPPPRAQSVISTPAPPTPKPPSITTVAKPPSVTTVKKSPASPTAPLPSPLPSLLPPPPPLRGPPVKPPKPTFAVSPLIKEGLLAAKATRIIASAAPERHHTLEVIRSTTGAGIGSGPAQEKEQDETSSSADSMDSLEVLALTQASVAPSSKVGRAQSFTVAEGKQKEKEKEKEKELLPPPRRRPESVQIPTSPYVARTKPLASPPKAAPRLARAASRSSSISTAPPPYQPSNALTNILNQTKDAFQPVQLELERMKRSSLSLSRPKEGVWGRRGAGEERLVETDPEEEEGGPGMDKGSGQQDEGDVFGDPGPGDEWGGRRRAMQVEPGEGWKRLG